jgi:SP family general alpha glucoside:H+ symporter-like MFS transporter
MSVSSMYVVSYILTCTKDSNASDLASAQLTNAIESEDKKGFWRNATSNRRAVLWSILLSTAVIMEGFDILLIQNLIAVNSFQRTFGQQLPDGSYELTAAWQAGLTNGAILGEMIGLAMNGILADRYGFKKTMIGGLVVITFFIFIPFFATNIIQLLVGLIVMGIPWGIFQTLTTTYAAEVCPTNLRPYLTTYVNLCWVIGQFLASAVLLGTQSRSDDWAYRIPYALQWIWPVPLIVGIAFAPESPWWLVRQGKMEEAVHVLKRLANPSTPTSEIDEALAQIKITDDFEKSINEGTSYLDCFKGVDLRRTEIVCVTWLVQSAAGSTFFGYSTYFYQAAGLASEDAFSLSLGQYAIGGLGTVLSWALMGYFGRRTLHLSGLFIVSLDNQPTNQPTNQSLTRLADVPPNALNRPYRPPPPNQHRKPLGDRQPPRRLHLHLPKHRRAHHLQPRSRDPLNAASAEERSPSPQRVQRQLHRVQHPDNATAQCQCVGLGC